MGEIMTKHYTCPGCGATVEYDPADNKLHCPFCKKSYSRKSVQGSSGKRRRITQARFLRRLRTGFGRATRFRCMSCSAAPAAPSLR